jgi:hypothetical protein
MSEGLRNRIAAGYAADAARAARAERVREQALVRRQEDAVAASIAWPWTVVKL